MATFHAEGIDGLMLDLAAVAELPDDVIGEILDAGGQVVANAQKQELESLGLTKTRKLKDSIKVFKKVGRGYVGGGYGEPFKHYVLVYPAGKRGQRKRRKVTKAYKRSKHGRTYTYGGDIKDVTNAEVGFIHEFGAPHKGIPAKQWMRTANEKAADAMAAAELAVYDQWLKSKNL